MYFLGTSFIGDSSSYTLAPNDTGDIKKMNLKGGVYDSFAADNDPINHDVSATVPNKWEVSTIFLAEYDGSPSAGALDVDIDEMTGVVVKRRDISDANPNRVWFAIRYDDLFDMTRDEKLAVLNSPHIDTTNRSSTIYEYAVVPIIGDIQATTVTQVVESKFDGTFFVGPDATWGTIVTDAFVNVTRNIAKAFTMTLNSRYPVTVTNAVTNYDSGTVTGDFVPFDPETCQLVYDDMPRNVYQDKFMDFLADYKKKVLKTMDGRIWLVDINPSPQNNANGIYYRRQFTINWTEVGSTKSQSDMYYAGFYDVPLEYWEGE